MGVLAVVMLSAAVGLFPIGEGPELDSIGPLDFETITLEAGSEGRLVEFLQARLASAGYRPGDIDGRYGGSTRQAVIAFQKYHGLERTGAFDPAHWELLDERPAVRLRTEANRIEIDLGKQVLYLVQDNRVSTVVPISSGNGETFENYAGNTVRAFTPEGQYEFYKQRNYLHTSYLGAMYKPYYFRGGYAIHGSPNVPAYPASHGCIRVTNSDMDFLRQHLELGMSVYVYGLRTESPDGVTTRPAHASLAA